MLIKVLILIPLIGSIQSYPGGYFAATGHVDSNLPPPISFDKAGNVGVNFGGYHASAGLGGLLSGDATKGGLHAEAGTPFGQEAAAGIGGVLSGSSKTKGAAFAGATAGGGISASAGLSGGLASEAVGDVRISESTKPKKVVVSETHVKGAPEVHRTVIEKTVIPNYIEKKVQETQYVEKTIKVPQTVEKVVRIPVAPTVIEKHVDVPSKPVVEYAPAKAGGSFQAGFNIGGSPGYVAKPVPPPVVKTKYVGSGYLGSGGGYAGGASGVATTGITYRRPQPQLFTDIFNIPISTLGAVRNLLTGIVGGTAGSLSFNKQYSASAGGGGGFGGGFGGAGAGAGAASYSSSYGGSY